MTKEVAMKFMDTERFLSFTPFSVADMMDKMQVNRGAVHNAIETMLTKGYIRQIGGNINSNRQYVRAGQAAQLLKKKWRSKNVGEIAYYKGFHWFGNADSGWRGSL
jgi:DNA-binding transcriptional MocR family regulator